MSTPKKNTFKKNKRPHIPDALRLQLWNSAAGICQFPGCNKAVWRHGLTLTPGNFAKVAHIIGVNGARSNEESEKLAKDFSNLLLLCGECHDLIDNADPLSYPYDLLRKWKCDSEGRIGLLLGMQENRKRRVVVFSTAISRENLPIISFKDTQDALRENSNYPSTTYPYPIEIKTPYEIADWENVQKEISQKMIPFQQDMSQDKDAQNGIALFALGAIPLLVQLGMELPRTVPVDVYQRNRAAQTWTLGFDASSADLPELEVLGELDSDKTVAVVISFSGKINTDSLPEEARKGEIYCINLNGGIPGMICSPEVIQRFSETWLTVQKIVSEKYGENIPIHLFAAVPAAIAVRIGHSRLPGVSPPLQVYEYHKDTKIFFPALTLK